ncbi:mechanosensitive ion channel family protein [Zavarzinia compransoris]|uniref:mechanosensitive ion channel family protein n=1 Tax=Zavarzinia marina TaxID=2911065 RepID=UPI001F1FE8FF|nr:mechanosensitive ion channel domain-containing protein [Zavarzinia marina]MCF4164356.1 mechanosensitive ion channel family protein [Zavarzinia marina]
MNDTGNVAQKLGSLTPLLPPWAVSVFMLAAAVTVGVFVHWVLMRLAQRLIKPSRPFLQSLEKRIRAPSRVAFLIAALSLVIQDLALPPGLAAGLARALAVAFILLVGWSLIVALHIAGDLHLRRFRSQTSTDNFLARKHYTQIRLLLRAADLIVGLLTVAAALMTFETVRQYGVSLFASAGVAGIVAGFAARPVLANLFAGIQIALTQPIRVDDAVIIENEWGWIEDITSTYVVVKIWDWRRLIVPLTYFIDRPFQNWTRESTNLIGSVHFHADYRAPVDKIRVKLEEIAKESPLWDGNIVVLQVVDATDRTIQLRALVSAATSPEAWDLRCEVREKLLAYLNAEYPECLPRVRLEDPAIRTDV